MTKDIGIGTQTWPLQITFRTYVLVRPRRIPDLHGQLQLIPEDDLPDTQALSFCGSVVKYFLSNLQKICFKYSVKIQVHDMHV